MNGATVNLVNFPAEQGREYGSPLSSSNSGAQIARLAQLYNCRMQVGALHDSALNHILQIACGPKIM